MPFIVWNGQEAGRQEGAGLGCMSHRGYWASMGVNAWSAILLPESVFLSQFNIPDSKAAGTFDLPPFQLHINHKLITNASQKRLLCYKYIQRKEGFNQ